MVLRIAAGRHVEDDARAAFLRQAGAGELQAELRLADAAPTHDHGQGARQQSAAQVCVEAGDTGGKSRDIQRLRSNPRDAVAGLLLPTTNEQLPTANYPSASHTRSPISRVPWPMRPAAWLFILVAVTCWMAAMTRWPALG